MTRSVKIALLLSLLVALSAAALLTYSVREASKPIERPQRAAAARKALPALPTIGLPGDAVLAGGGGFFRVLPYGFSRWAIRQVNREGHPAVFYFHPWEIDPGQPRVAGAPLRSRLRHYTNLSKMAGKLSGLLGDFEWGRMDALAAREQARSLDWAA